MKQCCGLLLCKLEIYYRFDVVGDYAKRGYLPMRISYFALRDGYLPMRCPNYPVKDLKTFQYLNVLSCLPRVYCTGKDLLVKNTNKGGKMNHLRACVYK